MSKIAGENIWLISDVIELHEEKKFRHVTYYEFLKMELPVQSTRDLCYYYYLWEDVSKMDSQL